jgi:hypothetical protein
MVPGAKNMGMGITLPFEDGLNEHVTPELAFEFYYFFTRKFWMVSSSCYAECIDVVNFANSSSGSSSSSSSNLTRAFDATVTAALLQLCYFSCMGNLAILFEHLLVFLRQSTSSTCITAIAAHSVAVCMQPQL